MRDGLQQRRYPFHQAVVTALSAYLPKDLLVFSMPRSPCYGKILCDDDPISAFCLVFMIGHKFFCRRSVFITVIRNHCGDHHTVFKLRLVDRDWFKDFRQFHNAFFQKAYEQPVPSILQTTGVLYPSLNPALFLNDIQIFL